MVHLMINKGEQENPLVFIFATSNLRPLELELIRIVSVSASPTYGVKNSASVGSTLDITPLLETMLLFVEIILPCIQRNLERIDFLLSTCFN